MKTLILPLFNKRINFRLATSFVLGLLLFLTPVAIAGFAPRNRKPASDYTKSGGSRGCPSESIPLTLLAPQTYIAYTTSLHPTFVGFVSTSHKIEFRIFEFISDDTTKQLGNPIEKQVAPGIFEISLPKDHPGLTVGKKYFWQVAISCPGDDLVEAAEFLVVETPSTLKSELSTTANSLQKADIYAKAGLWYEALAEALKSANNGKLGQIGSNLVQDFAKYESPRPREKEELVKKRILYLQTIANKEK